MPDRSNAEALFLEHLGSIERAAAIICGKHGVWGDDADDFTAQVKLKVMDDDYAVIRNFRGESSLKTYLGMVVVRQFQEYRRTKSGRWRTSAEARRIGPPAPQLEALVHRDGYRVDQAGQKLRTQGITTDTDTELARLLERLPARSPMRPVHAAPDVVLAGAEGPFHADERVAAAEAGTLRDRVMAALDRAIARLEPEDRMIAMMHFADGYTLAQVARTLRLAQKPLYRRVEKLLKRLLRDMEAEGVRGADVQGILGDEGAA